MNREEELATIGILLAIDSGRPIATSWGFAAVDIGGQRYFALKSDSLTDLESRKWIEYDGDTVRTTETGRYWADKLARQRNPRLPPLQTEAA